MCVADCSNWLFSDPGCGGGAQAEVFNERRTKISHSQSPIKTVDGIVDYIGDGVVSAADQGQGDRGQSYSWAAIAHGDDVYVSTCYNAMGNTLTPDGFRTGPALRPGDHDGHSECALQWFVLYRGGRRWLCWRHFGQGERSHRGSDAADVQGHHWGRTACSATPVSIRESSIFAVLSTVCPVFIRWTRRQMPANWCTRA